jgi:integrase
VSRPRGHVARKQTKRYGVRWYPVVTAPGPGGTRVRKWHPGHATKREAQRALTEILGAIDRGGYVAPSRDTLATFLERDWLPDLATTLSPAVVEVHQRNAARITAHIGGLLLVEVGPEHCNRLYAELLTAGRRRPGAPGVGGGLAPSTVHGVHRTLHKALGDAARWGRVPRNAAALAAPPSSRNAEMAAWTRAEARAFLAAAAGDRLHALWLLLVGSGLRRGEACGLRWADVDLEAGLAQVRRTRVIVGGKAAWGLPKTRASERAVPLPAATVAALRARRAQQAAERLAWAGAWQDSGLVFTREDGAGVHPDGLRYAFTRLCQAAGVRRVRLHDLRHTFATLAMEQGVPARVVAAQLGHASAAIAMDRYAHVSAEAALQAASAVSAALFGPSRSAG